MAWVSLRTGLHRCLPGSTIQPIDVTQETLKSLGPDAKICDVGAGGRRITPDTFTIDGFVSENTDLICDIHKINLESDLFDCVFCTGTLEHVTDPDLVVDEIIRIARPGGIIHIEVPFIQGFHADPHDYWRWTLEGLRLFCNKKGLAELYSGVHIGPSSSLVWILNEYFQCLCGNNVFGKLVSVIARFVFAPIRYLDYVLNARDCAKRIASGVYFVGKKQPRLEPL